MDVSSTGVAKFYGNLLDVFIIDQEDADQAEEIEKMGIRVLVTNTLMRSMKIKRNLALLALKAIKGDLP